jgi:hypothetical protein
VTARQAFDLFRAGRRPRPPRCASGLVDDPTSSRPGTCWARRGWRWARRRLALAALDRALALDPVRPASCRPAPRPGRRWAATTRPWRLRRRPGGAIPTIRLVLNAKGVSLRRLGRRRRPWRPMTRPWRSRRAFVDALCNRGVALSDLGRFEQALAAHDRAIQGRAARSQALANRAALLSLLGTPAEAAPGPGSGGRAGSPSSPRAGRPAARPPPDLRLARRRGAGGWSRRPEAGGRPSARSRPWRSSTTPSCTAAAPSWRAPRPRRRPGRPRRRRADPRRLPVGRPARPRHGPADGRACWKRMTGAVRDHRPVVRSRPRRPAARPPEGGLERRIDVRECPTRPSRPFASWASTSPST